MYTEEELEYTWQNYHKNQKHWFKCICIKSFGIYEAGNIYEYNINKTNVTDTSNGYKSYIKWDFYVKFEKYPKLYTDTNIVRYNQFIECMIDVSKYRENQINNILEQ
jgi:hypothetical protein